MVLHRRLGTRERPPGRPQPRRHTQHQIPCRWRQGEAGDGRGQGRTKLSRRQRSRRQVTGKSRPGSHRVQRAQEPLATERAAGRLEEVRSGPADVSRRKESRLSCLVSPETEVLPTHSDTQKTECGLQGVSPRPQGELHLRADLSGTSETARHSFRGGPGVPLTLRAGGEDGMRWGRRRAPCSRIPVALKVPSRTRPCGPVRRGSP